MHITKTVLSSRKYSGQPRVSEDVELECVRRLRDELRSTYPEINVPALFHILKQFRLREFPAAFLMAGGVRDRSELGARSMLSHAADGEKSRAIHWHPLFSSEYYDAVNPDIAAAGVPPWLHYQVHGRAEGRSPHPLVDCEYLSVSVSEVLRSEVIDRYLTSPELWVFDTSPYVDCQKFVLSGDWDGVTNPLVQIVTHYLDSQWVRKRLMIVDAASASTARTRMIGSSVLLTKNKPGSQFAPLSIWATRSESAQPATAESAAEYTVVPGFFLGSHGRELWSVEGVRMSPDSTVIRLATEFLSLGVGRSLSTDVLVHVTGACLRGDLTRIVRAAAGPTAISPNSSAQELALTQIVEAFHASHVDVLPHGTQTRVTARRVILAPPSEESSVPVWSWSDLHPSTGMAIVLTDQHSHRALNDHRLKSLLSAGASLCIVTETNLSVWLPILQNRDVVLVEKALLELVKGIVEDTSLYLLPGGEVGNQS